MSALLALLATAAVVLVLVIDGPSSNDSGSVASSVGSHPSGASTAALPRALPDNPAYDAAIAASVGSRPTPAPDESRIAASIGSASEPATAGRPDESNVAASIDTH